MDNEHEVFEVEEILAINETISEDIDQFITNNVSDEIFEVEELLVINDTISEDIDQFINNNVSDDMKEILSSISNDYDIGNTPCGSEYIQEYVEDAFVGDSFPV